MRSGVVTRWYLLPLVAMLCAGPLAAQGATGSVSGQVSDSASRAALSNAEILLSAVGSSASPRSTRTNTTGRYTFTDVAPGEVMVSVRLVGFAPKGQRATVRAGQPITVDFVLVQQTD